MFVRIVFELDIACMCEKQNSIHRFMNDDNVIINNKTLLFQEETFTKQTAKF